MASCIEYVSQTTRNDGTIRLRFNETAIDIQNCGETNADEFVLLTRSEYTATTTVSTEQLNTMFETYFAFDSELFAMLNGWMLLSFVVAYGVGKVVNVLGISNKHF